MNKPTIYLLFGLCLLCVMAKAQAIDDFSDGNFTHQPAWFGDDSLFTVNSLQQLQLRATPGTAKDVYLSTASTVLLNTEFSLLVGFNLNPSSQNFSRFYISSDQENLKGSLNGYYLQFGGHTGSTDSIVLFKQQGLSRTAVLWSQPGIIGKNNNLVRVKLIVNNQGIAKLYTDTNGGFNYRLEPTIGQIFNGNNLAYTGVFVRFTTSNISNYYFDDLYVGPERIDTEPPRIIRTNITNDTTIILNFNEPVKKEQLTVNNLWVNGLKPNRVVFNEFVYSQCTVITRPLANGKNHQIELFGLTDVNGNIANDTLLFHFFYMPQTNDIVITELMPDPDPPAGLPNAEFVELYNNSPFAINLQGWTITDGSSTATFGEYWLQPARFLIVSSAQHAEQFRQFGEVLAVTSLPSLNNSGDNLFLRNQHGTLIHSMSYTTAFYKNTAKSNGGYSLEMTNPKHLCKGIANWQASLAELGGTPGKINSQFDTIAENIPPQIIYTELYSNKLLLVFNELVQTNANTNIAINGGNKKSIQILSDSVWLFFEPTLSDRQEIEFNINGITDCIGNEFKGNLKLTYYEWFAPKQNELIVTEIMHSPTDATATPVAEYIELYNRSKNALDLTGCTMSDNSRTVTLPSIKILPDSFIILCAIQHVALFNRNNCYGLASWPSFASTDKVVIKNKDGFLLHAIHYSSDWHRDAFKQSKGGYSIEMIDTENPCGGAENWRASNSRNGGTPGYTNSVKAKLKDKVLPELLFVYPQDSIHLRLDFSETIDSLSVSLAHIISAPIKNIQSWRFTDDTYQSILLQFAQNTQDENYKITISDIKDCYGNTLSRIQKDYGKLIQPDSGMLVINEILFNPLPRGADFIELYNNSNHYIDLKNIWLSSVNDGQQITATEALATKGLMLPPKSYMAFSSDPNHIKNTYQPPKHAVLVKNNLPPMADNSGNILLHTNSQQTIDRFNYNENMHFPLLPSREGVSLERINPYGETAWQSASHTVKFATPGYQNSHYKTLKNTQQILTITPEVFSVTGNNHAQQIAIQLKLNGNNNKLKLAIYNSNGMLIKNITTYANVGSEPIYFWDGTTNNNEIVKPGIYIVYAEVLDLMGNSITEKSTVVAGY